MRHNDPNARILHLSVKPEAFEVMLTGEKWQEYRNNRWLYNELMDEDNKVGFIRFDTSHGNGTPYFICKFNGVQPCANPFGPIAYSNGYTTPSIKEGDFIIYLGPIVETGNLKSK